MEAVKTKQFYNIFKMMNISKIGLVKNNDFCFVVFCRTNFYPVKTVS